MPELTSFSNVWQLGSADIKVSTSSTVKSPILATRVVPVRKWVVIAAIVRYSKPASNPSCEGFPIARTIVSAHMLGERAYM